MTAIPSQPGEPDEDSGFRLKTGIEELDQLLRGGFKIPFAKNATQIHLATGLLVLLRGDAGTGKSTLAAQIAEAAWWGQASDKPLPPDAHRPGPPLYRAYYSLEQTKKLAEWRFQNFKLEHVASPFPDEPDRCQGRIAGAPRTLIPKDAFAILAGHADELKNKAGTQGCIAILDGLSVLRKNERQQLRFERLADDFREIPGLHIIVYEPREGEEEILDHRVDVVIELEKSHLEEPVPYTIHRLHILKTRYQEAAIGRHQYKFRKGRIEILPSIHFQVHHPGGDGEMKIDREPSPNPTEEQPKVDDNLPVLERVVGRLEPGNSIALFGARGSFKTELSIDFLSAATEFVGGLEKKGLLISLQGGIQEDQVGIPHIRIQCPNAGNHSPNHYCYLCRGSLLGFHQPPGCITPAEFLRRVRRKLDHYGKDLDRLVFWDLTQLDYRFPLLKHDPMFLPALLEMLSGQTTDSGPPVRSQWPVTSMFIGAGNADYTKAFSALADNVVFCLRWQSNEIDINPEKDVLLPNIHRPENDFRGVTNIHKLFQNKVREPFDLVLLYVDRTAGKNRMPNKQLYAVPTQGTKMLRDLYHIHMSQVNFFHRDVRDWIKAVNLMQGVH